MTGKGQFYNKIGSAALSTLKTRTATAPIISRSDYLCQKPARSSTQTLKHSNT
jgi:hypothetical protein